MNGRTGSGRPTAGAVGTDSGGAGAGILTINGSGAAVQTIVPASAATTVTSVGGVTTVGERVVADWSIANIRVYTVDFVNGLDTNIGFVDAAGTSAAQYAAACVAAGVVAKKTFSGLAAIFPRFGAGRLVEIIIANAGVNTAQAYADNLQSFLNDISGYLNWCVRATGTNTTAGCLAFDGTAADLIYQGGITVTGLNVAGYNPAGASTTSLPCVKVGGAAAALPAEPAAPLGWRVRFDALTTTVGLRNQCRQIAQVVGDTITPQSAFTNAPVNTDVFYIEQPGVTCNASSIVMGLSGVRALGSTITAGISGILITGTLNLGYSICALAFCGCAGTVQTDGFNQILISQFLFHPVLSTITVGGGFRSGGRADYNNVSGGFLNLLGMVSSSGGGSISNSSLSNWQVGCYAAGIFSIIRNVQGAGIKLSDLPASIGTSAASNARPRIVGQLRVIGGNTTLGNVDISGAGAVAAIEIRGCCILGLGDGLISGSVGNTDVGLNLTLSRNSFILVGPTLPTLTGTLGDVRLAGGQIVTWAQLFATGLVDQSGNRFISAANFSTGDAIGPFGSMLFTGALFGGAGAVTAGMADGPPSLIVANEGPVRYAISLRLIIRMRVIVLTTGTNTIANTLTLYKNGIATGLFIVIPAGSVIGTKFAVANAPVLFADGDDLSLVLSNAGADAGNLIKIGATLEYTV